VGSIFVVSTLVGSGEFEAGVSLRSAMGQESRSGLITVYHAGYSAQRGTMRIRDYKGD